MTATEQEVPPAPLQEAPPGSLAAVNSKGPGEEMVLYGVKCPLNWAKAKVRLEQLRVGSRLALLLDDPRAVRDIPRAAEAHGYAVVSVTSRGDRWRIEIER